MGFNPQYGASRAVSRGACGYATLMYTLSILGSSSSMYSESLDLHAASPLYQCSSLEDLDRYLLVLVYTDVWTYGMYKEEVYQL